MRRGFTILELLAATALTALLMVAILHVLSSLGRSNAALARQKDVGAWCPDFLDALRHDLSNATTASFKKNVITMSSHGALERTSLARTQDPVTVTYGLTLIHGRPWLVRTQSRRDGTSESAWAELVCADVTSFAVKAPGTASSTDGNEESIPPIVSVNLETTSGTVLNQTLVLR